MATSCWYGCIGMVPLADGFRLQALSFEMQAAAIAVDVADIAAELGDLLQVALVRLIHTGKRSLEVMETRLNNISDLKVDSQLAQPNWATISQVFSKTP